MDSSSRDKKAFCFDELLEYYKTENLNVIPLIHGDKKPASEWKEYQQRKITKDEINRFFRPDQKAHNIGVVCGAISDNLYVLDFDSDELFHKFFTKEDGLTVVKTGRGYHVYFKAESPVKTLKIHDGEGREIATLKGEGSYVVAPPSRHPSGCYYEFTQRGEIPRLQGDVRQQIKEHAIKLGLTAPKEKIDIETLLKGVPDGNRDNSLTYLIHFLVRADVSKENALKICEAWNERNKPPMGDVRGKVEYHYGLTEPYSYFFSLDPGMWNVTDTLTLEKKKKSKALKEEKEIPQIALEYKNKDFGLLELEKSKESVLVTIKRGNDFLTYKSHQRFDFWTHDAIVDRLFKYIKNELKDQYPNFLSKVKPQIEEMLKPKREEETEIKIEDTFDEETKEAALKLLKDPALLYRIKEFLGKWGKYSEDGKWKIKKPIVGEDGNKLHVTCSCVSAIYPEKINDLLLGKSSIGKTRVVSVPLLLFKDRTEDLAGMSAASPKYIEDDLEGKIFVLKEIEGSEAAEYYLKILFDPESEDMKVRTSEKDPGTNHYTSVVRQTRGKPVGITTTALPKYGVEFRNRFSLLQLDESKEQTKRIKEMEMRMKKEIPEDLTKELEKFRCAFSLLQPLEVKIPFDVFYPSDEVEARRAYKRLLTLIEINTLLHQYQREKFVGKDGNTYLKATIVDFYYAYIIAKASIGMDIQGLTENALKLYKTLLKRHEGKGEKEWQVSDIGIIVKEELNVNWTRDTIRGYLKELREADYLTFYEDDSKRGKPYIYSLRFVDAKDVSFCRFFAENANNKTNVSVELMAEGEEALRLLGFVAPECKGVYVYDPIGEKMLCITSEDEEVLRYIHQHSYPRSTNTNNTSKEEEGTKEEKDTSILLNGEPYKKQQIEKEAEKPKIDANGNIAEKKYKCVCGAVFGTVDELGKHRNDCVEFKADQSKKVPVMSEDGIML